ncbi:endo alpha-1,4 polygalactosaminidase [Nocardioides sp. cx-173]|uniref:endo alpha-1,4 polygalactosaminidase n=1 Tax=Nocardioides sp. cx-173 TaxID=2898796 RepID=UPI001E462FAC|nr:endo alpha-1,4 polygalactosaminidase [Nocardioides sp. cx-173]MCD4526221.1 endo alpha-1,4 polygalactosaminidase [Nocardioides sp. cx-173]UGB40568.1 endo alpha-1,4 polygalactosaminidase [Nocardioides sp. cx-173]
MRRALLLVLLLGVLLGGLAAAPSYADVEQLPAGTDVDYQLGGARALPAHVGIVVRDRDAEPAAGRYNVCYVNGFQTQPDERRFWRARWWLVLKKDGRAVVDEAWGEWLLDLRTARQRQAIARIMSRWTRGCAADGFAAVEYDNLDSFTRSQGMLRRKHAAAMARLLVRGAHRAGLAAGQKNLAGYDGTRVGFDFAVAEECGRYDECGDYTSAYGARVLVVEYRRQDFDKTCAQFGDRLAVVLRDRALRPDGRRAWC